MPEGVVTFHRQVLATPPQWEKSSSLLSHLHVDSEGTIEDDGHGMLQVLLACIGRVPWDERAFEPTTPSSQG